MGKILFTTYRDKKCALYLSDNRLIAAEVMNENGNRIGAVYVGKIKNVVKNIDACFVEIANGEICFLSQRDVSFPVLLNRNYDGRLIAGDEILVQISREAQKTKQASVTANISLSNEYAAISIGSSRIGYSGKLSKERKAEIGEWLLHAGYRKGNDFMMFSETPESMLPSLGLVVRTKADTCTEEELTGHVRTLAREFENLLTIARHRTCFSCIRQAAEDFEAVLDRLVYDYEYEEILTDDETLYEKLCAYCKEKLPTKAIRYYEDSSITLSKLYSLEQKMDSALNMRVWLKSGGYLVIEHTEALTVIDVNSGKYEAKKAQGEDSVAQAAYEKINREAVVEIALQLRLRNLSGIILVDFINMNSKEKEEQLLHLLRESVRKDKIKTLVVDMTPLGLVEITRKKQNKPLREQFNV